MKITNGIVFIWSSTNASIPSGWSRVTALDSKYPKGTTAGVSPGSNGGADTHSHTSPAHTHTGQNHTHQITIAAGSGSTHAVGTNSTGTPPNHTHPAFTSGTITGFSASSVSGAYGLLSNHPPYYTVIYITPTTFVSSLPAGIIALSDATPPSGFNVCDGNNSTPNLVDKYLLGAATSADAGSTGGSLTNTHTLSHVHTTTHSHVAATSTNATPLNLDAPSSGPTAVNSHTHSVTLPAVTPSTVDNITLGVSAETVEPAYTKLLAMKSSAISNVPYKTIALWLGALNLIPRGWVLCDGTGGTIDMRDRHLKVTATAGAVGNTGGSNTHTHAAQTHSHTIAHTHSAGALGHSNNGNTINSGQAVADASTVHASASTDSVNLVTDLSSTTADSASNEPRYSTVAFIKLVSISNPNVILMKLFN